MRVLGLLLAGFWPAIGLAVPWQAQQWPWPDSLKTRELDEVVISTEKADGTLTPAHTTGTTAGIDAYVARLTGADLVARGMYAAEPVFRGMAGERVPVTINKMKIFGACTDKMDPVSSYVATNNLKSMAINKDAGSVGFVNATAGALDLRTKTPVFATNNVWHWQAGMGFRSVNAEKNMQAAASYSGSKWAMRLNGTWRQAGNYRAGGGREVLFSQYEKMNTALNTAFLLNDKTLLGMEYIYDRATDVGYPALPMDVALANGHIYALTVNHYLANGEWEAKIYGNNIYHEMDDSQRQVVMHMDMPGWRSTYGSYFTWKTSRDHNTWSLTAEYYMNRARAEMTMYPAGEIPMFMLTWPDVLRHDVSLAASHTRQWEYGLRTTLSARVEYAANQIRDDMGIRQLQAIGISGVAGNEFILPALSVSLQVPAGSTSKWNVQAAWSQRQPGVSEAFGYYLFNIQDNYDYIGDPRLKPETAWRLEGGYSRQYSQWRWRLQLYGYYMPNYIVGEIRPGYSPMTIGAAGVKFYVNLPFAYLYGFEADVKWQPLPTLSMAVRAQIPAGQDANGEPLPLQPPLKSTTNITWANNNWHLGAEWRAALAQNKPRLSYGESRTPGYGILNLQAGYRLTLNDWNLDILVAAKNLFDQYYWDHLDFNNIPQPGRSMEFSIRVNL